MPKILLNFFRFIDHAFAKIVETLLVVVLLGTVFLTFLQVILRNFLSTGIPWAEIAGRNAVIWIAFLGAMLATRARQHLNIDAITRLLPYKPRNVLRVFLDIFSAVVCAFLANASLTFVIDEKAMGTVIFLGIESWMIQTIIPFGFAMISIEYFIGSFLDIYRIFDPSVERRDPTKGGRR